MKRKIYLAIVRFALKLAEWGDRLLERFDKCCYLGCENRAETWCITGGHRHCYDHESGYYNDVEMCQACFETMTPEEIARDQKEQVEFDLLNEQ